jgi:predicted nucleic acid-binding protein
VRYLLDTNVVSELQRSRPAPAVQYWILSRPASSLFISVLTLGEVRKGAERLLDPPRRRKLEDWIEHDLCVWLQDRILPIDRAVAERWGRMMAQAGRTLPAIDSLIAATAVHHGLTLVSRNLRDFHIRGLEVFDPWQSGGPPLEVHEAKPRRAAQRRTTKRVNKGSR